MVSQLLCSFSHLDTLQDSIDEINEAYSVHSNFNIKCYYYVKSPEDFICVYNVNLNERRLASTISINRKKEVNTYYSINALNLLIKLLNGGILDRSYRVEWKQYSNMLLLADGDNCKMIEIKEFVA